jgi:CysZ protein
LYNTLSVFLLSAVYVLKTAIVQQNQSIHAQFSAYNSALSCAYYFGKASIIDSQQRLSMNPTSPSTFQGSFNYVEAHRWLKRTGRLKWLFWPLLCSLVMLPAYGYGIYFSADYSMQWIVNYFGWQTHGWAYWLVFPLVLLIVLFVGYLILKNIIMLLCVPMNVLLAEAVMEDQLGKSASQTFAQLMASMLRALLMTLFTLVLSIIISLLLLAISFIPVAGAIVALILGIVTQGFLAAWGFFDPVYERAGCGIGASFGRSVILFPQLVSNGVPFVLLFQIPVLGWTLAPTYGTVSGALYACQLLKQGKLVDGYTGL